MTAVADICGSLARMGLLPDGARPRLTPLEGGVSSEIFRVEGVGVAPICIKRALPQLRVRATWRAPVERNASEAQWLRTAGAIVPDAVPRLLGEDRAAGLFAMEFLDPADFPVWKTQLSAGSADPATALGVAERIARIHAATAGDDAVAERFATDAFFWSLRLEPYLQTTARVHPECAAALEALAESTATTRRALVHGDVSPKNVLVGPRGPVLLDAECAWYGDPAFDLAFCANHLLLKCLLRPAACADFLTCFDALARAYLARVTWEPVAELERRAARLLPALLLARIDGKSPVEYVTREEDRERVRRVAVPLLSDPQLGLAAVRAAWAAELGA